MHLLTAKPAATYPRQAEAWALENRPEGRARGGSYQGAGLQVVPMD